MSTLLSLVGMLAAVPTGDPVQVSAKLAAEELKVGETYELILELAFDGNASAKKAGMPAPMLQLDIPAGVELEGKHLTTYKELADNEFLREPFERMIEDGITRVAFRLSAEPAKDATIGLIVTGYVDGGSEGPWFLRKRLELPLAPKAIARAGDDANSSWSGEDGLVRIGQSAPLFALPKPDGSIISLDSYLGASNIIITTYRAHW